MCLQGKDRAVDNDKVLFPSFTKLQVKIFLYPLDYIFQDSFINMGLLEVILSGL